MKQQEYDRLKATADRAKADADRAQGALDQLLERLKDEFECESVAEAKKLLAQLQQEAKQAEEDLDKALAAYTRKWKKQ